MPQKKPAEVITVAEALTRIGLASLIDPANPYRFQEQYVGWDGYPTPFACGHTDTYGFGPLKKDCGYPDATDNDHKGSGRLYQERVRVNQFMCSGEVLFSFAVYRKADAGARVHWDTVVTPHGNFYQLNSSMVVSIDTIPDSKSTCLKLGFTA